MIKTEIRNLLNRNDFNLICHQVNCKGVMNAGIAKNIRNKYPEVFDDYYNEYQNHGLQLGKVIFTKSKTSNLIIASICGQAKYGNEKSTIYTDYSALMEGLDEIKYYCLANNISNIGIPGYIGCGLANGDWNEVSRIIYKIFDNSPINVTVCILPSSNEKLSFDTIKNNFIYFNWLDFEMKRYYVLRMIINFINQMHRTPRIAINEDKNITLEEQIVLY